MKTILILGANSAIARATARLLAGPENRLVFAGLERERADMEKTAADLALRARAPKPLVLAFDGDALETHDAFLQTVVAQAGEPDEVYLFFGRMSDQSSAAKDFKLAQAMLMTNFVGAVSILERVAARMEGRRQGLIAAVSSVAGDRGRQSNYIYGASKGGLTVYLQGLRNRLAPAGVHVLTLKPGMVDTPMTRDMKKGLLFSQPETIAAGIVNAARRRRNTAYLPGWWRWVMAIITAIPEPVFKRLKL